MKFVDEYRDGALCRELVQRIFEAQSQPWTLMEVCGGQTHAIVRFGIDQLLPDDITLLHGPGCPVCVTPVANIDAAIALSQQDGVVLTSFGDMLRVPGTQGDLASAKAAGGDVRVVYSPLDAVKLAQKNPDLQVVFFAVGFETTAPANAMAVLAADRAKLNNFSLLVSHVLVPPAIEAILQSPDTAVDGFLAAGHVCTIMGWEEYEPIAARYEVPIVVTGFEPADILQGVLMAVEQLEKGEHRVENQYARAVREGGNPKAQVMVRKVFTVADRNWRGIGQIPNSGLQLADDFGHFDASSRFHVPAGAAEPTSACRAGDVLRGAIRPSECPEFGVGCTPEMPLGAPMVSSEGACAAYFKFRRRDSS